MSLKLKHPLILLFVFFVLPFTYVRAQETRNSQIRYLSEIDQGLSIQKLAIVPFIDNVNSIYSTPLTESTSQFIEELKQWTPQVLQQKIDTEKLSTNDVKKICGSSQAQALLTGRFWKGPRGLQMNLILYTAQDGLPLLMESQDEIADFSIPNLQKLLKSKLNSLMEKMPYQGVILSRRGQDVTLNLGTFHGLRDKDTVNVVQILSLQRHPKQQFMVGHDKTLIGQIHISKADKYLSFGQIQFEKEQGSVLVGSKVKPDQFIQYTLKEDGSFAAVRDQLENRVESDVSFGDKSSEWMPRQPPQYGLLQVMVGFLQYNQNLNLQNSGALSASNSLAPTIALTGEAWLNDFWYFDLGFRQSAFSVDNSMSGSSPAKINMSLGKYNIGVGYNVLLDNSFFGPKLQLSLGMSQFSALADETSPLFLTKMNYGGIYFGFKGGFPLGPEMPLDLGFQFKYFLTNTLNEGKSSGGSSGVKSTEFGFFTSYRTKSNYNLIGQLNFEYYASSFSGSGDRTDPASSISHKITSLLGGVEYFF